jgi:hypothetical protein
MFFPPHELHALPHPSIRCHCAGCTHGGLCLVDLMQDKSSQVSESPEAMLAKLKADLARIQAVRDALLAVPDINVEALVERVLRRD